MRTSIYWPCALLAGGALIGCGRETPGPTGTGARERVQSYFEALIQGDDPGAYAALDSQSQRKCSLGQFSQLATKYRSNLGFEPGKVFVRGCEEHGIEATAHIVLAGHRTSQAHRYKDGISLRREEDDWRVVLPANFGRSKKR